MIFKQHTNASRYPLVSIIIIIHFTIIYFACQICPQFYCVELWILKIKVSELNIKIET